MVKDPEETKEEKGTALIPTEGEPRKVLGFAAKASQELEKVIKGKKKPVMINDEQYLEFEDWQTIARFYGATVGIEWTKRLEIDKGESKAFGYEAKALVHHRGEIISSAESMCMSDEKNWGGKPEFQLRSMAQTRACAKALRNVFAWVAVMAGYKGTPAEEIAGGSTTTPPGSVPATSTPVSTVNQYEVITKLAAKLGHKDDWVDKWVTQITKNPKSKLTDLTKAQADEMIRILEEKVSEK